MRIENLPHFPFRGWPMLNGMLFVAGLTVAASIWLAALFYFVAFLTRGVS